LACGSVACRLELRLKVVLRPRQLRIEQPLVLLLTLTREQPSDLIAGPREPPPIDAEGARSVALRDRQFLNVREHVAALALDVRKGGFETLQRPRPHCHERLYVGGCEQPLPIRPGHRRRRPAGRGRRAAPAPPP
jgi:hypothetical protein